MTHTHNWHSTGWQQEGFNVRARQRRGIQWNVLLEFHGHAASLLQPQRAECVDFTETEGQREEGGRKTSMEKTGHRAKLQYYNGGGSKVKNESRELREEM